MDTFIGVHDYDINRVMDFILGIIYRFRDNERNSYRLSKHGGGKE